MFTIYLKIDEPQKYKTYNNYIEAKKEKERIEKLSDKKFVKLLFRAIGICKSDLEGEYDWQAIKEKRRVYIVEGDSNDNTSK